MFSANQEVVQATAPLHQLPGHTGPFREALNDLIPADVLVRLKRAPRTNGAASAGTRGALGPRGPRTETAPDAYRRRQVAASVSADPAQTAHNVEHLELELHNRRREKHSRVLTNGSQS